MVVAAEFASAENVDVKINNIHKRCDCDIDEFKLTMLPSNRASVNSFLY